MSFIIVYILGIKSTPIGTVRQINQSIKIDDAEVALAKAQKLKELKEIFGPSYKILIMTDDTESNDSVDFISPPMPPLFTPPPQTYPPNVFTSHPIWGPATSGSESGSS